MGSTSSLEGPVHGQRKVMYAAKQLESAVYRLAQERGRWPYLTPIL